MTLNTPQLWKLMMFVILIIAANCNQQLQAQRELFEKVVVDPIQCDSSQPINELSKECDILNHYKQSILDRLSPQQVHLLAIKCACELASMDPLWRQDFDTVKTRELEEIVVQARFENEVNERPYFWNDFEVVVGRYSILENTIEYFSRQLDGRESAPPPHLAAKSNFRMIYSVCKLISKDPHNLYHYLENLIRLDTNVFIQLVKFNPIIQEVQLASRACKFLLLLNLIDYEIRIDEDQPDKEEIDDEDSSEDIDSAT